VVIGDAERAQGIAGIIGGSGSEVSDTTTEIFLEVAAFNPPAFAPPGENWESPLTPATDSSAVWMSMRFPRWSTTQ